MQSDWVGRRLGRREWLDYNSLPKSDSKWYFIVLQYAWNECMERKISRTILELMLFYIALRGIDEIKYYCHCTDGEIEE